MAKWEYCQVGLVTKEGVWAVKNNEILVRGNTYLEIFNKLGSEGWEMCGNVENIFYFKRQVN